MDVKLFRKMMKDEKDPVKDEVRYIHAFKYLVLVLKCV